MQWASFRLIVKTTITIMVNVIYIYKITKTIINKKDLDNLNKTEKKNFIEIGQLVVVF